MADFASQRHLKPDVARRIIQFLESNAHGVFFWVVLIMKELERRDERLSDEVIALRLSSTPLTLIDTYKAILHSAHPNRKQEMWRVFRRLLFGSRSITLLELEKGLCLETGIPSWCDFAGDLKFLCGSLTRLDGVRQEVTLVHQTARDFLEVFSRDTSVADLGGIDMDPRAANEQLAAVCVQYLLTDEIFQELKRLLSLIRKISAYKDMMQTFLSEHSFLRYAIESWACHSRALGSPSAAISTMIRRLLYSQTRRDDIMMLTYFINKQMSTNIPRGQTPLHIAAYFNISWLAQMYISVDRTSILGTTEMKDTPLIWASEMGSTECVRILLDAGANPNEYEIDGWSALHWAARNGHFSVAKLLLKHGANLDQCDSRGHTPLDWAKDREHWDLSRLRQWSADRSEHGRRGSTSQGRYAEGDSSIVVANWNTRQLWDHRP